MQPPPHLLRPEGRSLCDGSAWTRSRILRGDKVDVTRVICVHGDARHERVRVAGQWLRHRYFVWADEYVGVTVGLGIE